MSTPAMMPNKRFLIRASNIPESIRNLDDWLMGDTKRTPAGQEAPRCPTGSTAERYGELGGSKDCRNLASFDTALRLPTAWGSTAWARHHARARSHGAGYDDCIDDNGEFSEFANEVINSGTYVDHPAGAGLRAVHTGPLFQAKSATSESRMANASRSTAAQPTPRSPATRIRRTLKSRSCRQISSARWYAASRPAGSRPRRRLHPVATPKGWHPDAIAIPNMIPAQALRVLKGLPKHWGTSGWYVVPGGGGAAHAVRRQRGGYEVLDAGPDRDGYDEEGNRRRWGAGFARPGQAERALDAQSGVQAKQAGAKFKQATLESWGLVREAQEKLPSRDRTRLDEDGLRPRRSGRRGSR